MRACDVCGVGFVPRAPSSKRCGTECRRKHDALRTVARRSRRTGPRQRVAGFADGVPRVASCVWCRAVFVRKKPQQKWCGEVCRRHRNDAADRRTAATTARANDAAITQEIITWLRMRGWTVTRT